MVIWIIGLSGSGKSFYANKINNKLKKKGKKTIIIDGDEIRKYITNDLNYNLKDREKNSKIIQKICHFLENQGFIVICAILSIIKKHQKENRKLFNKYFQIYINTIKDNLIKKNKKKIYSLKKNVVGQDIKFPHPYKSDLEINNNFDNDYEKNLRKILRIMNV